MRRQKREEKIDVTNEQYIFQRKLLVKKLWKQIIQEADGNCKRRCYPSEIKLSCFLKFIKRYRFRFIAKVAE
jgi:hypothetical protein